jgi:hypothetical protein
MDKLKPGTILKYMGMISPPFSPEPGVLIGSGIKDDDNFAVVLTVYLWAYRSYWKGKLGDSCLWRPVDDR